ncbi:uncharacterized protein LOC134438696 [Engraulis encrasicolus]|uniref:uncharacterized protein LOC134438696 n=1 Tax=Engraulis encrasicolus TaxID=184585 RepID=UPI002FCED2C3
METDAAADLDIQASGSEFDDSALSSQLESPARRVRSRLQRLAHSSPAASASLVRLPTPASPPGRQRQPGRSPDPSLRPRAARAPRVPPGRGSRSPTPSRGRRPRGSSRSDRRLRSRRDSSPAPLRGSVRSPALRGSPARRLYSSDTVYQLRCELRRRGLRFFSSARKAELIQQLCIDDDRCRSSPARRAAIAPSLSSGGDGSSQAPTPVYPAPAASPLAAHGLAGPAPAAFVAAPQGLTVPARFPPPLLPGYTPPAPLLATDSTVPPGGCPPPAPGAFRLPSYTLGSAGMLPPPPHAGVNDPPPVSLTLRHQILAGADVDLSSLLSLFPDQGHRRDVDCGSVIVSLKSTGPASRVLSFTEFVVAFSRYTDVICSVFPHRQRELNDYLAVVAGLAVSYGGAHFYTYHRLFSAKCAARVSSWNQCPYWGALDLELHSRVFLNVQLSTCAVCCASDHRSADCPMVEGNKPRSSAPKAVTKSTAAVPTHSQSAGALEDRQGHDVYPRQVCHRFNVSNCTLSNCRFLHVCNFCAGAHARLVCPVYKPANKRLRQRYLKSPIVVSALAAELASHPDREFTSYLLSGLTQGFHPGISAMPTTSFVCDNLLSAVNDPSVVSELLASEVKSGFMIGPFSTPPFPSYRVNPIGVATRKYSGKKRLIVDLSAPHNILVPSINSLIPIEDYSMSYQTVDDAVRLVKLAGRHSWLFKADITAAFKGLPIDPDFWHLFGVSWRGLFYFAVRLTFGCRSSPKIFDTLSEALCWILSNNYDTKLLVHLLDDFLTVTPPTDHPSAGRERVLEVFGKLGVPISEEKTCGPVHSLEFLGIIVDSSGFFTALPKEKVDRIITAIDGFLTTPSTNKQALLSLLGHVNFAMRVIPQGRAFVSNLLTTAHSVPALDDPVSLDAHCMKDLEMWRMFLLQWNGHSMFYEDHLSSPEDIRLFTDAAPSVGFGGYYDGRWFASPWPPELSDLSPDMASSAAFEMYPVVIAALLWGSSWSGRNILVYCDNEAAVFAINKCRSRAPLMSRFLRRLVWTAACHQFTLTAAHVPGTHNGIADSLSRLSFQRFRTLAPDADPDPTPVPPFSDAVFL